MIRNVTSIYLPALATVISLLFMLNSITSYKNFLRLLKNSLDVLNLVFLLHKKHSESRKEKNFVLKFVKLVSRDVGGNQKVGRYTSSMGTLTSKKGSSVGCDGVFVLVMFYNN